MWVFMVRLLLFCGSEREREGEREFLVMMMSFFDNAL